MCKRRFGTWLIGAVVLGLAAPGSMTQGGESKGESSGKELRVSLRDVINRGAKIFNENGDYAGCFRLYEGALLAVRPVVDKALQQEIDTGLAGASKLASYSDKAFQLRRVLDRIREQTGKTEIVDVKKSTTDIIGAVALNGALLRKGAILFLDAKGDAKFGAEIDQGLYKIAGVESGKYRVIVQAEEKGVETLPPQYSDWARTKLMIEIVPGKSVVDFDLKIQKTVKSNGVVTGRLTLDGKPIRKGAILFLDDKGDAKFGAEFEEGRYQLKNVAAGKYRVIIQSEVKGVETLPPRYSDWARTKLTIEIGSSKSAFDFDLKSK